MHLTQNVMEQCIFKTYHGDDWVDKVLSKINMEKNNTILKQKIE